MTTREELREAIKDTLRLYGIRGEQLGSLRPGSVADALLVGPLATLIADAERWRNYEQGLDDYAAEMLRVTAFRDLDGKTKAP